MAFFFCLKSNSCKTAYFLCNLVKCPDYLRAAAVNGRIHTGLSTRSVDSPRTVMDAAMRFPLTLQAQDRKIPAMTLARGNTSGRRRAEPRTGSWRGSAPGQDPVGGTRRVPDAEPARRGWLHFSFWLEAAMDGDHRSATELTCSTRPDYPALTSGCPRSRLRDSHSAGMVLW